MSLEPANLPFTDETLDDRSSVAAEGAETKATYAEAKPGQVEALVPVPTSAELSAPPAESTEDPTRQSSQALLQSQESTESVPAPHGIRVLPALAEVVEFQQQTTLENPSLVEAISGSTPEGAEDGDKVEKIDERHQSLSDQQEEAAGEAASEQSLQREEVRDDSGTALVGDKLGPASSTVEIASQSSQAQLADSVESPLLVQAKPSTSVASTNTAASTASARSASPGLASSTKPSMPAKKFTSLNVNKKFLEKASPNLSPATVGKSTAATTAATNRLSTSSPSTRLATAKLTTAASKPASPGAKWATPAGKLAGESAPSIEAGPAPALAAAQSATTAVSSPRLMAMSSTNAVGRSRSNDSSTVPGKGSPGLRNAGPASSNVRTASPGGTTRAPWALKPPSTSTSGSALGSSRDFPTAAEAARAKQAAEERVAAAAAEAAQRQEAALQSLEGFRGTTLAGNHWDEMEDDDGFLDEVVEFGDGTQYKVHADDRKGTDAAASEEQVSKEERFKDVTHDRSWPPRSMGGELRGTTAHEVQVPLGGASSRPPPWGPRAKLAGVDLTAAPAPDGSLFSPRTESIRQPVSPASERAPSTTSMNILQKGSTASSLSSAAAGAQALSASRLQREREAERAAAAAIPPERAAAAAASSAANIAARAWGPLAQRQAALNPNAPKPVPPPVVSPPAPSATKVPSEISRQQEVPSALPQAGPSRLLPPHLTLQRAQQADSKPVIAPPHAEPREAGVLSEASRDTAAAPAMTVAPPAAIPPDPDAGLTPIERARKRRQLEEEARAAERDRARAKAALLEEKMRKEKEEREKASIAATASVTQHMVPTGPSQEQTLKSSGTSGTTDSWRAPLVTRPRASAPSQQVQDAPSAQVLHARQALANRGAKVDDVATSGPVVGSLGSLNARVSQHAGSAVSHPSRPVALSPSTTGPSDTSVSWRRQSSSAVPPIQAGGPSHAGESLQASSSQQPQREVQREVQRVILPRRPVESIDPASQPAQLPPHLLLQQQQQATRDAKLRVPASSAKQAPAELPSSRLPEAQADRNEVQASASASAPSTRSTARPIGKQPSAPLTNGTTSKKTPPSAPRAHLERATSGGTPPRGPRSEAVATALSKGSSAPPTGPKEERATPQQQQQLPATAARPVPVNKAYPVAAVILTTRPEAPKDPPPVWNKFVVRIKPSGVADKGTSVKGKGSPNAAARASALVAKGSRAWEAQRLSAPVYPLSWQPPIPNLPMKTLSRDDHFFPKKYQRGIVVTPVKVPIARFEARPARVFPRKASASGPHVNGLRKETRFSDPPVQPSSTALAQQQQRAGQGSAPHAPVVKMPKSTPGPPWQASGSPSVISPPSAPASMRAGASAKNPTKTDTRSPFHVAMTAAVSQGQALPSGLADVSSRGKDGVESPVTRHALKGRAQRDADASGATFRNPPRSGAAAAALEGGREPSPVNFMVNSELEKKKKEVGVGPVSLPPFSLAATAPADAVTPSASNTSLLPSPNNMSGSLTWGQSSLTFPMLENPTSLAPDSNHLKSVWSLTSSEQHSVGAGQNSLRDIQDDFLPSSIPLSVHDLKGDDAPLSADSTRRTSVPDGTAPVASNSGNAQSDSDSFPSRFGPTRQTGPKGQSVPQAPVGVRPQSFASTSPSQHPGSVPAQHPSAQGSPATLTDQAGSLRQQQGDQQSSRVASQAGAAGFSPVMQSFSSLNGQAYNLAQLPQQGVQATNLGSHYGPAGYAWNSPNSYASPPAALSGGIATAGATSAYVPSATGYYTPFGSAYSPFAPQGASSAYGGGGSFGRSHKGFAGNAQALAQQQAAANFWTPSQDPALVASTAFPKSHVRPVPAPGAGGAGGSTGPGPAGSAGAPHLNLHTPAFRPSGRVNRGGSASAGGPSTRPLQPSAATRAQQQQQQQEAAAMGYGNYNFDPSATVWGR